MFDTTSNNETKAATACGADLYRTSGHFPYYRDAQYPPIYFHPAALAIDIAACRPLAEFEADMEHLIAEIKSARPAPGSPGIFYPGEIEATSEARIRQEGITLPDAVATELRAESARIGVACPF